MWHPVYMSHPQVQLYDVHAVADLVGSALEVHGHVLERQAQLGHMRLTCHVCRRSCEDTSKMARFTKSSIGLILLWCGVCRSRRRRP